MLRLIKIAGLVGLVMFCCQGVWAQSEGGDPCQEFLCPDYSNIKNKLNQYIQDSLVNEALDEYKALAACDKCPEHQDELDSLNIVIFDILKDQLERAEENARRLEEQTALLQAQKAQISSESARRQRLLSDLEAERDRNLAITRDALASKYMGLAQRLFDSYDDNATEKAFWLTDFVFQYIDPDHHMVQSMMHKFYFNQERGKLGEMLSYASEDDEYLNEDPEISVVSLAWSPDKEWLATGLGDGRLVFFNRNGVIDTILVPDLGSYASLNNLDWHPKNNELVVGNTNGDVFHIQYSDQAWIKSNWEFYVPSTINQLKWSPDGEQLAIPTADFTIQIFDKGETEPTVVLMNGHTDWARGVAWSPDGQSLVSVGDDNLVNIWDLDTKEITHSHDRHTNWVFAVDWHPTQPLIVSGGNGDQLLSWNYETDSIQSHDELFLSYVRSLKYSEDGSKILVTKDSDGFSVIYPEGQSFDQDYDLSPYPVFAADWLNNTTFSFGGDGPQLTTYSVNQTIPQVTDSIPVPSPEDNVYSNVLNLDEYNPNATLDVEWSPSGDQLLASFAEGLLVLYHDTLSQVIRVPNNQIHRLAWQPGLSPTLPYANHFATADGLRQLSIWDANTLSVVKTVQADESITALCWSPEGEYLATGDEYGQLNIWSTDPLELERTEYNHSGHIRSLAWSPDGRYILSGSDDYSAKLWDTTNETVIHLEQTHVDWVRDVVWVDKDRFVSISDDYSAFFWCWDEASQNFSVTDTLSDSAMQGYYFAGDLVIEDQYLAMGTQNGDIGYWFMEGQEARLDTVIHLGGSINSLSWHPSRMELLVANSGLDYPLAIDRYLNVSQHYQLENFPTIERTLSILGETKAVVPLFNQHQKTVGPDFIQWSPDDQLVAIIQEDQSAVQVFDVAQNALLYELTDFPEGYRMAIFSRDGEYLACSSVDGAISIYDAASGENPTPVLTEPNLQGQNRIDWSAGKQYLAIVDNQKRVQVWDQRQKRMIYDQELDEVYTDIHFSPADPNLLALASTNSIVILDVEQADLPVRPVYGGESYLLDNRWARNGESLVLLFSDGLPAVYGVKQGKRGSSNPNFGSKDFTFWDVNPNGKSLFSYVQENLDRSTLKEKERNAVQIWDLVSREQKGVLNPTKDQVVTSIDLSPDERYLVTASYTIADNYIRDGESVINIWDVLNQRSVFELTLPPVRHLSFSPDGQYLVTFLENNSALFWPMDIDQIHTYLLRDDKDAFLEQLGSISGAETYPLAGLINEWSLENNLLLEDDNFNRLGEESAPVRLGWGQYFLNRARLAPPDDAQLLFERALAMLKDDEIVTLKGEIQIARAKNFFQREQTEEARKAIRQAYRANPDALNIRSLNTLLNWQDEQKKKAFHEIIKILSEFGVEGEETLRTDFLQLQDYGLSFPDEATLWRLITRDLPPIDEGYEEQDVLPYAVQPHLEQLTLAFDTEDRTPYLTAYFERHTGRMDGENPDTNLLTAFFERAVSFLNEAYDSTTVTQDVLLSYYNYQRQLTTLYIFNRQWEEALSHMEDYLAASRMEYQRNENSETSYRYHYGLVQKAWIIMLKDRETITPRQLLSYIDRDSSSDAFIHSRFGHLALIENRSKEAYQIYHQVLLDVGYDQDVIEYIYNEINLIDPEELIKAQRLFNTVNALENSINNLQDISSEIGSTSSNAEDKLLLLYQQKTDTTHNILTQVNFLIENDLLPQDTLQSFELEHASDHAYLAHYLLLNEKYSEAEQMARKAMDMDSTLDWPMATIVNAQLIQGQWKECRKSCNAVLEKEYDCGLVVFDSYEDHILETAGALPPHPNIQQYLPRLKTLIKNKKR